MESLENEIIIKSANQGQNVLELKSISQLLGLNFFIPSYQRGYRWTEKQVIDLLDDISVFSPKPIENSDEKTWYCLQPLVIKECENDDLRRHNLKETEGWFEVIDGQQRLTTIFIVLHYLNQGSSESRRKGLFELHYATREGSHDFLKEKLHENREDASNIDFYHMSKAYMYIHNWFIKQGNSFNLNDFESKFIHSTKVIWYESQEKDSIAIFTRINIGKIPLTNAELIKALFLNSSNFTAQKHNEISLKQLEIANEWDKIEYALQDEAFWYFVNESENKLDTRIEFIFNLMANKPTDNTHDYSTFIHFSNKFLTHSKEEVTDNWNEIKRYFQILDEWFTDRELYHKIGFLISTGEKINSLITLYKDRTKNDFKDELNTKICDKVNVQLTDLEYPNPQIRKVLLLHNIQTMLDNKSEDSRFPFNRYKKENWDIEHVNSVAEEMPNSETHQKDWLNETSKFLKGNKELHDRSQIYNKEGFEKLFQDILNYFNEQKHDDDTNGISNLVLLDSKTNRGYKNAVFPLKRNKIIEKDKNGTFIPICTKNVFMKFYCSEVSQMTFWGENERSSYLEDIKRVLKVKYLPTQKEDIINE